MPLPCPRCPDITLGERRVAPSGGAAAVDVYVCATCSGVWLDGPTLAAICPTLAHLPQHRDEIALLGGEGEGISLCLRCGVAPFEYKVIGVAIDFCLHCHGVWLDGDEYEEAMLGEKPVAQPRGGPYRRSASALATGDVKCAYCGERVPPKKAYVRELGPACTRCHFEQEQRRAAQRAAEMWAVDGPRSGHDVAHTARDSGLLEELEASVRSLLGLPARH